MGGVVNDFEVGLAKLLGRTKDCQLSLTARLLHIKLRVCQTEQQKSKQQVTNSNSNSKKKGNKKGKNSSNQKSNNNNEQHKQFGN